MGLYGRQVPEDSSAAIFSGSKARMVGISANISCTSSWNSTSGAVALLVAAPWFLWNIFAKARGWASAKLEPKYFIVRDVLRTLLTELL